MAPPAPPSTLEQLLGAHEVVIFAGAGGVGKTTSAAAAGLVGAHSGAKALVITVDPARRLATAMGLGAFGNVESKVPTEAFASANIRMRGELWAAMLDTKASWDDLIKRHAPDVASRDRILANPLYHNITARFIQSHDYIAMERLFEIHASGRYDLVVVDTPPSRNALDFLDAPGRMADFFSSRLLRWLTVPARSRLLTFASRPFYEVADRILGSQFLGDIAEFFGLFQMMEEGFVARAEAVTRILGERRTTFVVVSTPEVGPTTEAEFFVRGLRRRQFHLGAVVVNKVLPPALLDPEATRIADSLREHAIDLGDELATASRDPVAVARILHEVAESHNNLAAVARRELEQRRRLTDATDLVVDVPWLADDVTDLASLWQLAAPFRDDR